MTSILYNAENVLESAIAAALSVSDVDAVAYVGEYTSKHDGTVYVFQESLLTVGDGATLLVGVVPIGIMGKHSVPKPIISFINKHATEIAAVYVGMLDSEEYSRCSPFTAFYRLFSSLEFDIRSGADFLKNAAIRDKHAREIAGAIPSFMYKGSLFLRFGPFVDVRVDAEKSKKDVDSIVVYSDNTGFSNGEAIVMKLVVHGNIPSCLASASFDAKVGDDMIVGSISLAEWASIMKGAKYE